MVLTTEDLHRHVWSGTLADVATKLGLTVSVLRTLCDGHAIARPSVADWAQVRKGAVSAISELTPEFTGHVRSLPVHELTPTGLSAPERKRLADLPTRIHPSVSGVTSVRGGWGPAAIINTAIEEVRERSRIVARRDRFSSSIAHACQRLGGAVTAENGLYRIEFGAGHVLVKVTERLRKVRLPIKEIDRKWQTEHFKRGWRGGWEPTGRLVFEVDTYCRGFRQLWEDTERRVVENEIEDIVGTLRAMCHAAVDEAKARAEAEERRRKLRLVREEEAAKGRLADERWGRFANYAVQWRDHALLGRLLRRLKSLPMNPDEVVEGVSLAEWIAWLEERLSSTDPLKGGAKALLTKIVSGRTDDAS